MDLKERHLADLSHIQYKYFTCPFIKVSYLDALIVTFEGQYGYGSKGNPDARFMSAIIKAGLEAWSTSALILDFRTLRYEWGDMMGLVFSASAGRYIDVPFPLAVVISDLNREGLISLVEHELTGPPFQGLCESLEDALHLVEEQHEHLYGE